MMPTQIVCQDDKMWMSMEMSLLDGTEHWASPKTAAIMNGLSSSGGGGAAGEEVDIVRLM